MRTLRDLAAAYIRETVAMSVSTRPEAGTTARRRVRPGRVVAVVVVVVALLVAGVATLAASRVVLSARADDADPTDVIVVLGAAQFWGRPSPVLEARLAHARDLFQGQVAPEIVTVGGKQQGDLTTEGAAGREWLTRQGVPSDAVTAVPTGTDTLSSLTAVARLMQRQGWTSATIVTDPAHQARSLAMARALGIDAHGSPTRAGAGSSLTADCVARETAGLMYFWVAERRGVTAVVGQ